MLRSLPRSLFALAVVCTTLAATASTAFAAPVALPGSPLTVYVGPQGQLQGYLAGGEDGIYFAPSSVLGDAGFFLAFPEAEEVWGFNGVAGPFGLEGYEEISQGPVTGSGTAADPLTQVTEYGALELGGGFLVTQTTTYVNGSTEFKTKWAVKNQTGVPVKFRAFAAADFYFEGDDRGTGIFTPGPPRFIGGTNVDSGRSGGFVEVNDGISPPWTHYQELPYPDVWTVIENTANFLEPSGFDDTVNPNDEDNAGGVEWDQYRDVALANGASATFELIARVGIPTALQLSPTNAGAPQGVPINISATAVDSNGAPYAGNTLRYTITGVNPGLGALTLNAAGQGVITDPGTNAGGDTIAAFVDFNNDGIRGPAEPQASALATFVDGVPASCKVSVKGDRPGSGGVGNALVISVKCNETSFMTIKATLLAPASKKAKGSSASARKFQKARTKKIKLPKTKATIRPGANTSVQIKVPKGIARKYAGKKLTVKIVATVKDGAGNVSKVKTTGKVTIAGAPKKKGKH